MKVVLAGDHAGFELKEKIKAILTEEGYDVVDHGPFEYNATDDYPDFVSRAAHDVSQNSDKRGIIIGGSGEGEAMAANRFTNVRAAVYYGGPLEPVRLSRDHNDANILSLGARLISFEEAVAAVKLFLETPFSGDERHVRRLQKLENLP